MLYTGLDIGTGAIKFIRLRKKKTRYILTDYYYNELGLSPEAPEEEKSATIIQTLKELNQKFGLDKNFLTTAIGRHSVIIKTVFLPSNDPREIEDMIKFELERQIPFPIDKALTDYVIINNGSNRFPNQTEVHLFATKIETVNQHLDMLKSAGLQPNIVSVTSVAINRAFIPDKKNGVYVVLDVGNQFCEIDLLYNEDLICSRSVNLGGMNLTLSIQKELNIDYLEAEKLKKDLIPEDSNVQKNKKLKNVIEEWMQNLLEEVEVSLHLFQQEKDAIKISHIILTGGGSRLKGLKDYLASNLKMGVKYADSLDDIDNSIPEEDVVLFQVPVGLSLENDINRCSVNLIPQQIKTRQQNKIKRKKILLYATVALIVIGLMFGVSFNKILRNQIELNKINKKIEEIQPLIKEVKVMKDQMDRLREFVTGSINSLDILREVTIMCPQNVYLTSFSYEKDKVTYIKGRTQHHSDVSKFSIALGESPYFSKAEIKRSELGKYDQIDLVDFEIVCYFKNYKE